MGKPALLDFASATANEIVEAIDAGITTAQNLHAFRSRMGGATKSDKLYPETRKALNILKRLKSQNRGAKNIKKILSPYNAELAKGRDVLDIIQPVLTAWRLFYAKQGIGLMNDQVLLLKMVEAADALEKLTGESVPDMVATED
ncbi:TPA: hypothetical protein RQP16_002332 [Klebsiella michiganensis]|uniref:hypothetical protein n=1 Tax=Klebsiella/Raoultella group TaxID=2890311 RepID=UPI000469EAAD|nr:MULTISPECIES: hypothetical protein [Klebsiella]MDU2188765.1 hypothetical protein [Klebsiella pneumoniae]HDU3537334.1 hypothetical protein [Klebsiella variicola]EKQ6536110.1 hypothetical protein [Klebsiella michiganensis]ELQ7988153.1 hypothetical protein [Klebsiella michiganensis]MBZ7914098.1 hypothetical protein [Klebsiella michiganensis]